MNCHCVALHSLRAAGLKDVIKGLLGYFSWYQNGEVVCCRAVCHTKVEYMCSNLQTAAYGGGRPLVMPQGPKSPWSRAACLFYDVNTGLRFKTPWKNFISAPSTVQYSSHTSRTPVCYWSVLECFLFVPVSWRRDLKEMSRTAEMVNEPSPV